MAKMKDGLPAGPISVTTLKSVAIDGVDYIGGQIVELSADAAVAYFDSGDIDPNPEAVAYLAGEGVAKEVHADRVAALASAAESAAAGS